MILDCHIALPGCRFIHPLIPASHRRHIILTLPWAPLWQQTAALSLDKALIKPTLFSPLLSTASSPSPPAQAVSFTQVPDHKAPKDKPQHRATQALKICLSLMIQDSARHTDTQNWVEIQHLSGAADSLGDAGLRPLRWSQFQPHGEPQCPLSPWKPV